jgi:hypothetical protein
MNPTTTHRKRDLVAEELRRRFGKIRATVFPIENAELRKFFMMSGMMFFIIYVYTVVRDTKDTLIVSSCGAEAITFLKVHVLYSAFRPPSPETINQSINQSTNQPPNQPNRCTACSPRRRSS